MLIIGHRGYPAKHPENTARGFRAALAAGADGVECDIQQSQDGRFVVLHDKTLERTSNGRGAVNAQTWAQLQTLDFGQGEKILDLGQLLQLVPADRWLNIELKQETLQLADAARFARELRPQRSPDFTLISSFHHSLLPPLRAAGYKIAALIGEEHVGKQWRETLHTLLWLRPDYLNLPVELCQRVGKLGNPALLGFLRAIGYKFLFWTVNNAADFAVLRPWAQGVITNEVEAARLW